MANLSGLFGQLNQIVAGGADQGVMPQDPMMQNALHKRGVTNPMLQMFGKGLSGIVGSDIRTPQEKMQGNLAQLDLTKPDAMLQMANAMRQYDPVTAAKLIQAYEQSRVNEFEAMARLQASRIQTPKGTSVTEGGLWQDKEGNYYQSLNRHDKDTGESITQYLPIGDAPPFKDQKLSLVQESGANIGMNPFVAASFNRQTATEDEKTKRYNEARDASRGDYITAMDQYDSLLRSLELMEQANAEGNKLEGGISAEVDNWFAQFFGTRSETLAELNTTFAKNMYSNLRALFGAQITDKEREAVEAIFNSILKSGRVNKGIINNLMREADAALNKHELYFSSPTYKDFEEKLGKQAQELDIKIRKAKADRLVGG